jgi:phospholipid/cholesterol/gamma-HCH transport system substrate-binding protein
MAELEIKPSITARLRVTAVILSALAITATLVFLLSGGGRDSFSTKATISTFMPDVTGLARNSEVRLNGIKIGQVSKIDISGSLDPQRAVRVDMKVVSRFLKSIPVDSQTSVGSDTLVGYRFVSIDVGKSPLLLSNNGVLPSEPLKQAGDRADLVLLAQTELRQVDDLLIQVSSPNTKIGHYILGDQEYNGFLKQMSSLEKSLREFVAPDSVTGQAFFSNDMYRKFSEPLAQVDKTLDAIQRGEGPAGRFYASDDQYNQVLSSLQSLRASLADANAGKGQLGALLNDDAAYARIHAMLASTDAMIVQLQSGQGKFSHLLRDPQLYESLNGSLRNLQALLAEFRSNPRKYLRSKVF